MIKGLKNNFRWAALVTIAYCICYPAFYVKSDPACSIQVKGAVPFSPEFWKWMPLVTAVVLVAGMVFSAVEQMSRKPLVRPVLMILFCIPFLSFDHDYPLCNTTPPLITFAQWMGAYLLPTILSILIEKRVKIDPYTKFR